MDSDRASSIEGSAIFAIPRTAAGRADPTTKRSPLAEAMKSASSKQRSNDAISRKRSGVRASDEGARLAFQLLGLPQARWEGCGGGPRGGEFTRGGGGSAKTHARGAPAKSTNHSFREPRAPRGIHPRALILCSFPFIFDFLSLVNSLHSSSVCLSVHSGATPTGGVPVRVRPHTRAARPPIGFGTAWRSRIIHLCCCEDCCCRDTTPLARKGEPYCPLRDAQAGPTAHALI